MTPNEEARKKFYDSVIARTGQSEISLRERILIHSAFEVAKSQYNQMQEKFDKQLDTWILKCDKEADGFHKKRMELHVSSSLAMVKAYKNVKLFLKEINENLSK